MTQSELEFVEELISEFKALIHGIPCLKMNDVDIDMLANWCTMSAMLNCQVLQRFTTPIITAAVELGARNKTQTIQFMKIVDDELERRVREVSGGEVREQGDLHREPLNREGDVGQG